MVINGIIDLDNGELLEATGKHRISALDIQGSETAELKLTFYKNCSAVTDNSVVSGAVIDFGVKADADYTGTSYLIYHDTFSASTDGLTYSGTPTWATAEVETALGNESSVKLHGQVKVVISGVTYYSQVFEVEIHNNVIQAAGTTNSVIYPRLIQSTSDPTVNDDSLDGYGVSSLWLNTSSNAVHVLMDNTAGAAVWAGFLGLTNGQLANNLVFNDDLKAVFGTASDGLEIYHSSNNSYIDDSGTGNLHIRSNGSGVFLQKSNGDNLAKFNTDGAAELFYSGSKKIESTNLGCTISGKLIVSGDLDVDGTTTTFNSTVVTVDDPVFGIGGDTAPGSQDNKDRGVSFRYHDGTSAKVGFYGWDNSEDSFVFLTDTNDDSTEVFSGTLANLKCGKVLLEDGSASAPSVSFSSDSNTGIYRASGDTLAFSTGGTEAARFDSSGHFLVNTTTSSADVFQSVATDARYAGRFTGSEISGSSFGLRVRAGYISSDLPLLVENRGGTDLLKIKGDGSAHFNSQTTNTVATFESTDPGAGILLADDTGNSKLETSGSELRVSCDDDDAVDNSVIKFRLDGATKATLNSTGLGIGGTPIEKLTVDGNIRINGDNRELYFSGNQAKFRTSSASSDVIFETGTTELLRLDGSANLVKIQGEGSGEVFIGTANFGSGNYTGIGLAGQLSAATYHILSSTSDKNLYLNRTTGADIVFNEQNSAQMRLKAGGNLGIGTANPSVNLHVEDSGYAQFKVGNGTQFVRLYADADEATILADGSVPMRFYTSGTEKMRIDTSGNVGIANTNPSAQLTIHDGSSGELLFHTYEQYNETKFYGLNDQTGNGCWEFINDGTWNQTRFYIQDANNSDTRLTLDIKGNNGATDIIAATSSGNVGIGTTSPSRTFHVNSGLANIAASFESTDTGAYISFLDDSTTNDSSVRLGAQGNDFQLFTNGQERFRVKATGEIGIGTDSPSGNLTIEDSSNVIADINTTTANANTTIRFRENGSNKATIGYDGTNDGLILTTGGFTAGNGIFINDSQNVGIGTTSPDRLLEISDSTQATGAILRLSNTAAGSTWTTGDTIGTLEFYSSDASAAGNKALLEAVQLTGSSNLTYPSLVGLDFYASTNNATDLAVRISPSTLRIHSAEDKTWSVGDKVASLEFFSADQSGSGPNAVRSEINLVTENTFGSAHSLSFATRGDVSGSPTEKAKITSSGDMELVTDGQGLILNSADGTPYRITVANDGTVTSTAV
jgi:hypothetical protein